MAVLAMAVADHCKVLCIYKTLPRWRAWLALLMSALQLRCDRSAAALQAERFVLASVLLPLAWESSSFAGAIRVRTVLALATTLSRA